MKVWVLIPAYNEAARIGPFLEELNKKDVSVLVIDDGSSDRTYDIAREKADIALRNEKNIGKGVSLKTAIAFLLANINFDYIITMDADGQHSPCDIDSFLKEADNNAAFVIGNRMNNPCGMPKLRVITNKLMSFMLSKMVRQKIPDSQCGFRLIKREVLERLTIETN
ncbi:MAG: glycosyltransferase family 2 protein, partial [Candidatus Omnitrophota bacterium]